MSERAGCGPFVTMGLLVELFPQFNPVTIYRWKNTKGGYRLPPPDLTVGHVSLWSVDTIRVWAEANGKVLDEKVLEEICQGQRLD